jgi:hypothetical protein
MDMKQLFMLIAVCFCNLLAASGLDILTKGQYSFTPEKIYFAEEEIVRSLITGVWARNTKTNAYYSFFQQKAVFTPAPLEGFIGRKFTYQRENGNLTIQHHVSENGIISTWHLKVLQSPGGAGELGFILPGTVLKENAKIFVNGEQTGVFKSDAKHQQHLGSLRKSGSIVVEGLHKLCFDVKIWSPDQVWGVFVQKYHDGIRIITSYHFEKDDRDIQWGLSLAFDKMLNIPDALSPGTGQASANKVESQAKLNEKQLGHKNFELVRELFPLREPGKKQFPKSFVTAGEAMRITLQKKSAHEATYHWQLKNESERLIEQGTVRLNAEAEKYDFVFNMPKNGCYRLEVTDEFECKREALFAVFPPLPEHPIKDGILGASGVQDGLFELAEVCGLTWHRWHCGYVSSEAERIFKDDKLDRDYLDRGLHLDEKAGMQTLGSIMSYQNINAMTDQQYADFMQWWSEKYLPALVGHLKDKVTYFEVFNEPYYTFRDHPQRYFELLKISDQLIKQIAPGSKTVGICGPPISMGDKFFRKVFESGGIQYMDVLSFHQYCFSDRLSVNTEKTFKEWILHLRKLCAEYGRPDLPIWDSESSTGMTGTLYRLPENLRKIERHEGVLKVALYEQAAAFSRVLAIHYAHQVKYFFHLFNASPTYSCHITEFDGSPLPIAVAMAAIHRRLEGARLIHRDQPHPRVKIYQFRKQDQWVATIWLEQIRQNEKVSIRLPDTISQLRIYDFMGNLLRTAAGDLQVDPEPVFLEFSGETRPGAEWHANISGDIDRAKESLPGGVQRASAQDWSSYYYQIPLRGIANRSLRDEVAGDQAGGFTDEGSNDLRQLPLGDLKIQGIPYHITNPEENNGTSILVLNGYERPYFPSSAALPLPELPRLAKIHILHLCTYAYLHPADKPVYQLEIIYDDGWNETIPMLLNRDIADWYSYGQSKVDIAMLSQNALCEVAIFHKEITLGHPKGAMARVKELRFKTENGGAAIPVILAMTGILSN